MIGETYTQTTPIISYFLCPYLKRKFKNSALFPTGNVTSSL